MAQINNGALIGRRNLLPQEAAVAGSTPAAPTRVNIPGKKVNL